MAIETGSLTYLTPTGSPVGVLSHTGIGGPGTGTFVYLADSGLPPPYLLGASGDGGGPVSAGIRVAVMATRVRFARTWSM
jgi:hypothetical protein